MSNNSACITLSNAPGYTRCTLNGPTFTKHLFTFEADAQQPNLFARLHAAAQEIDATVLSQMVLSGDGAGPNGLARAAGVDWPLTWLRGDHCTLQDPVGCQAVAVAGLPVRTLTLEGRVVGRVYEDDDAVYCQLGGILPADVDADRPDQARSFFENMEVALELAGLEFHHVVRTWLYLTRLLEWYDPFNVVRTQFFKERGIFERMVPASTGIGASNPSGSALIGDAIAVKPKTDRVRVIPVASPLQCPALDYRSSFSRAAELISPGYRELYVSGTASIDPNGQTAHVGDPAAQIDLTMRVVQAILESRGMHWADVTQGIAYFKDMAYVEPYRAYCRAANLTDMPVIALHADVCRDDLLFEIEVDAVSTTPEPNERMQKEP